MQRGTFLAPPSGPGEDIYISCLGRDNDLNTHKMILAGQLHDFVGPEHLPLRNQLISRLPDFKKCVNKRILEYLVGELSNSANTCDYDVKSSQLASDRGSSFKDLIMVNFKDKNAFKRSTAGGQ